MCSQCRKRRIEDGGEGPVPTKKRRLCFTDQINVLVGPEKKRFTVHKDIICNRAPFFRAACAARWNKESQSEEAKAVELPVDDPDIFDIYLQCMYTNFVDVGDLNETLENEDEPKDKANRLALRLVHTYVLADKLRDVQTAKILIDAFVADYRYDHANPHSEIVIAVANKTPPSSPLRGLIIDFLVHHIPSAALQEKLDNNNISKAFLLEMVIEQARVKEKDDGITIKDLVHQHSCRYSQHDEENPSCGQDCPKNKEKEDKQDNNQEQD